MTDNTLVHSANIVSFLDRPRALDTILYGGLTVGILDGLYAVISANLRNGVSPVRVFQYIASGLLGRASFNGGLATAVLGILLHFLIAFTVAAVFYYASLKLPMLIRRAMIWGLIYGVAVYFVMSYIVVPLSAVTPARSGFSFAAVLNGVIVHALLVGLPVALFARRSAKLN